MGKAIAIHQPNFFPWIGYFYKVMRCDEFVLLDHVVMNPRTSIYPKRVRVISNRNEYWLTVPLKNKKDEIFTPICKMEINDPARVAKKHLKTIELNYKNAPFYNEVIPVIKKFYEHHSIFISERNIRFIKEVSERMGIKTRFVKSSEMNCTGKATELLIDIVRLLAGSVYLSGDGAGGYQSNNLYVKNQIELRFVNFQHPVYRQFNTDIFLSGLSIIDPLMNLGFAGTKKLLLSSSQIKQLQLS